MSVARLKWREPNGFVGRGTRVLLYSQSPVLSAVTTPETVWLSSLPGTLGRGPSDERMYVVDPKTDKAPYRFPDLPPFSGAVHAPVSISGQGHLDHFETDTAEFRAAHIYGCLRHVLDIWERYFGHHIPWHFAAHYARLEIVAWTDWDNAHSGYGFLEAGIGIADSGQRQHYALNFDVLAHELGHSILYSRLGVPARGAATQEYLALHEAFADVIALISVLHFRDFDDRLLRSTGGNLYQLNELNRIAEMSDSEQIRVASNALTMTDVAAGFGADVEACDEHRLGQPVTGAIFDVLVEVYSDRLRRSGVVAEDLLQASLQLDLSDHLEGAVQTRFAVMHGAAGSEFTAALEYARDYVGYALAKVCLALTANVTSFSEVHRAMRAADYELTDGRYAEIVSKCFNWRGIGYEQTWPSTELTPIENAKGRGKLPTRRTPYRARAHAAGLR